MKPSEYLRKAHEAGVPKLHGGLRMRFWNIRDYLQHVDNAYDQETLPSTLDADSVELSERVYGYCALGIMGRCVIDSDDFMDGLHNSERMAESILSQRMYAVDPDLRVLTRPIGAEAAAFLRSIINSEGYDILAKTPLYKAIFILNDYRPADARVVMPLPVNLMFSSAIQNHVGLSFGEMANILEAMGY